MKIINKIIKIKTKKYLEFRDITDDVVNFVADSRIKNGNVLVYSMHTTLGICINEKEKGFFEDFKDCIEKFACKDNYYRHNDLNLRTENLVCQSGASDCLNGHSHCIHLLIRNSETIPVVDGKLMFGTWQRVFAIELDCCRPRKIVMQVMGI